MQPSPSSPSKASKTAKTVEAVRSPKGSKPTFPLPMRPSIYYLEQSAAWDWAGYPIFAKRIEQHPPNKPHQHTYYEIVLVEAGTAEHLTAQGSRHLLPGDVIIIQPRIWHQYREPKNFQIVNCLFDRGVLRTHGTFLALLDGAFEYFFKPPADRRNAAPIVLHASPALHTRLNQLLNAMIQERSEKAPDWQAAMIIHLLSLLLSISRLNRAPFQSPSKECSNHLRTMVNRIIEYLELHFRETFSLSELSKRFHLSPSYISRLFSQRMGIGLVNYLHHVRIEEACRLLVVTDWTVTRIATEVGYDEFTYFSRRFRKEVGETPKSYRLRQQAHSV